VHDSAAQTRSVSEASLLTRRVGAAESRMVI
jgi:hypothetical protein